MDIVKDKVIELLTNKVKVKDVKSQIDFLTENEECNDLIDKTKAILRATPDEDTMADLPQNLLLAIAIILVCKDNVVFIEPEKTLEDLISKWDSAQVSSITSSIFVLLKSLQKDKKE